jgi:transcriptional regulator with XRE-family HTH domain
MAHIEAGRCLLRQLRTKKAMTQQELADLTIISRSQLSAYENNRYVMNISDAKSISDIIGCEIDDLYEWKWVDT